MAACYHGAVPGEGNLDDVELLGIFLLSFGRACINLELLSSDAELAPIAQVRPDEWCRSDAYRELFAKIMARYTRPDPIKERIGAEMMKLWYEEGPGHAIVKRGVDFLHHQTGSHGYRSVVRGPDSALGAFTLDHLDVARGRARIRSSTPFDKVMERGILIGGMNLPGDLVHVEVDNSADPAVFEVRFG